MHASWHAEASFDQLGIDQEDIQAGRGVFDPAFPLLGRGGTVQDADARGGNEVMNHALDAGPDVTTGGLLDKDERFPACADVGVDEVGS
jgi:hypothetical protein